MSGTTLLLALDGNADHPNLACMRMAHHFKAVGGDDVHFGTVAMLRRMDLVLTRADRVFASVLFERTRPVVELLKRVRPDAIVGGTGVADARTLASIGVASMGPLDYSLYPRFTASVGFLSRGCRLKCGWCHVPAREGKVREERTVADLWRGDPHPRQLLLLDNDFTAEPHFSRHVDEILKGDFAVCITQGVNVRTLSESAAEKLAQLRTYNARFTTRRFYTAWDSRPDEQRLFRGLDWLARYGVRRDSILVYMLTNYGTDDEVADWEHRRARLRAWGCRPYPMPFRRTRLAVGFQRYVIGAYDKRFTWAEFKEAGCDPYRLGHEERPVRRRARAYGQRSTATRARKLATKVAVLGTHGGARRGEAFQGSIITLKRGTSAAYRIARLKRDFPAIAAALARGEFASVSAAWRAAKEELKAATA